MKSAEEAKAFVLEALDLLFGQRDYATGARFWSRTISRTALTYLQGETGCSISCATLRVRCVTRMRGS